MYVKSWKALLTVLHFNLGSMAVTLLWVEKWWYRLMTKILITTIQVNFVLIPSEAGMRQHKLSWIVVINIFCYQSTPSQPFLDCPLSFQNFIHTGHFEQDRTFFLQPGCFLSRDNILYSYTPHACPTCQGFSSGWLWMIKNYNETSYITN